MKLWNKPWTLPEGFFIGGALMLVGLLLQLIVGPVEWEVFAWPVNGVIMAALLLLIAAMYGLRKSVYAFQFIGTYQAAIPTMVYAVALTIVMGLTRQTGHGSWLNSMLTFWPFVLIYALVAVILGLVVLRQVRSWAAVGFAIAKFRFSLLFHLGLFVAMTTATLGNADMQRVKMVVSKEQPEWRALDERGNVHEMPLGIQLKKFVMETYEDGSPRRYASEILIQTKKGEPTEATVDVNKPVETGGWKIYQYGYDTQMGAQSAISILELVSDPWLPAVYTGIYMMLAGAVCMFVLGGRRKRV